MKIAVIGSGKIGSTAARLFVAAGHEVAIANRRGPESLRALEEELGEGVEAATVEDAVYLGDIVLVAVPLGAIDALPADPFAGKIVIDANNYYPDRDGQLPELNRDETTSTELLARRLPGARVVKAFNTMYYATLAQAGDPSKPNDERLALFVAADDEDAKRLVSDLIDQLGFAAIDTGGLADGGRPPAARQPDLRRRADRRASTQNPQPMTGARVVLHAGRASNVPAPCIGTAWAL